VGSVTPEFCSGTPESLVSAGLISSASTAFVASTTSTASPLRCVSAALL